MLALSITFGAGFVACLLVLGRTITYYEQRLERLMVLTQKANDGREAAFAVERAHIEAARAKAAPDLTAHIDLIDRLCQRLQAPEQAVVEHAMSQPLPPLPSSVEMDDDDGHWETKEQLAEMELRAEQEAMRSTAQVA